MSRLRCLLASWLLVSQLLCINAETCGGSVAAAAGARGGGVGGVAGGGSLVGVTRVSGPAALAAAAGGGLSGIGGTGCVTGRSHGA